jgi:hypothetical protein
VNKDPNFIKLGETIILKLQKSFEVEINIKSETYISLKLNKILKIDLVNDVPFRYGELRESDIFSKVDNIENILSNKLSALISRDEPKDVVDIWMISKSTKVDWKGIYKSANSKAAGIFPPDVAKRPTEFPVELLDRIKWVDKKPEAEMFTAEINLICDSMLKV